MTGPGASVEIVLASASSARAALLNGAGLSFTVMPARVDEATAKESFQADGLSATDAAANLADLKARKISMQQPGALVIGADQMLDCNGVWFDKPPDRDHLVGQLMSLRGKTHRLHSAVCIYQGGERLWGTVEIASLTMRPFGDAFLRGYVENAGDDVLESVGGYRLEGAGAQLFSRIEGDYFTILGLPLLSLLDFLRQRGVLQT